MAGCHKPRGKYIVTDDRKKYLVPRKVWGIFFGKNEEKA